MKKTRKLSLLIIPALIVCAALAVYLIYTSPGYHRLFHHHHFTLEGSCMIYSVQDGKLLEDTGLHIEECQSSKAGAEVRQGKFVIDGYVDLAGFEEEQEENVFYSDAAWYVETDNTPGLRYSITRYENPGDKDQTLKKDPCYPEAFLQYDTDSGRAIIFLTYDEAGEDVRYLALYGFSGQEEALEYCRQHHVLDQ